MRGEGASTNVIAFLIGILSMVVGQAAQYHLFMEGGLFNVSVPVEAVLPAIPYTHFIVGGVLAILFSWAFGLSNMVRRMSIIAGLAIAVVFQLELMERYPGIYSAIFTEAYVTEQLG